MVIPTQVDNEISLLKTTIYEERNTNTQSVNNYKPFVNGIRPLDEDKLDQYFSRDFMNQYQNLKTNRNAIFNNYIYENSNSHESGNDTDTSTDVDINFERNNTSNNNNNNDRNKNNNNSNSFRRPKRFIANKKDRFDINTDTTRGFSNKTLLYNKNFKNKKDYLSRNTKNTRNSYKLNRIQRKSFSLVIRNANGITHDKIIENIKNLFDEYKLVYIVVSFEGRYPNTNNLLDNSNGENINNNNTNTTPNSEFIDISSINYRDKIHKDFIDENKITSTDVNDHFTNKNNNSDIPSIYDTSPHFHVLFKTKKVVDINSMDLFNNISVNDSFQKGTCFILKSTSKDKLNEISYIVKDGNIKTWGELPKIKKPKVKVTDDIANKIINENYELLDIVKERPGFALVNLKKIKDFKDEIKILKSMKDLLQWNMLLINIKKFNEKELEIFDWMIKKLPVVLITNERALVPLSDPQIYIYGGVGAGKTYLSAALRSRIPTYDFNENDHHNLYNDELVFLVIKDEFRGGSMSISKMNQFLDGQEYTINTKGGVIMKKKNQPCLFLSNYNLFYIYKSAIENTSIIKSQLKKRFTFVDLGVKVHENSNNNDQFIDTTIEYTKDEDEHGKSIYNLFNLIDSINNIEKENYEDCENSFKSVYKKSLLNHLVDINRISEFSLSKVLRYKFEEMKKVNKKLSLDDMILLSKLSEKSEHCKELLNEINEYELKILENNKIDLTISNSTTNDNTNDMDDDNMNDEDNSSSTSINTDNTQEDDSTESMMIENNHSTLVSDFHENNNNTNYKEKVIDSYSYIPNLSNSNRNNHSISYRLRVDNDSASRKKDQVNDNNLKNLRFTVDDLYDDPNE